MTESAGPRSVRRSTAPLRVGLFGILGAGNIGNDASLEAVLAYLEQRHPEAAVDAMTTDARRLTAMYGIEATPLAWTPEFRRRAARPIAVVLTLVGKLVETMRTACWVRRHDVVIVPGMGVLEASVPLRPWEAPYAFFVLCAAGRLFGTKVALVSVGADAINKRSTRWLSNAAARLACYRSYRDEGSRAAMRARGLDTARDHVFTDLVLGRRTSYADDGDVRVAGIGVMAYHGDNDDDRSVGAELYEAYVDKVGLFVRWLLERGRTVRLFIGDSGDRTVVDRLRADALASLPGLDPAMIVVEPISSFADLLRAMEPAGVVVATRYHNVMCALMLAKPVISLEYAPKNTELMETMGMSEYCLSVRSFEIDELIDRFTELEGSAGQLRARMIERRGIAAGLLDEQFTELSAVLFPAA